jgi:hypothetical protein
MYWTHLAQDRYHQRALENMTMVFGTPQKEMGLRLLQQGMRQWTGLGWTGLDWTGLAEDTNQ